jgi:hypothetical protein
LEIYQLLITQREAINIEGVPLQDEEVGKIAKGLFLSPLI